jgi:aspartate aminotransferase/aminotransferase
MVAQRIAHFETSGIRRVFDLAARLKDPINLSIGQPDFDVPEEVKQAAITAIAKGKNGYAVTQGIPDLREKLQRQVDAEYGHADRKVVVTSGTSGGLVLAMLALIDPGDEVLVFDPYFVMYPSLVAMTGGKCVYVDTHPDFRIDLNRVEDAITPRTKLILFNSPANPTGVVATLAEMRGLAELAARRNVVLLSDEIYRSFCYDEPFLSPAQFNDRTLVLDGFSKSHAMTGWRLGFAHGPSEIIDAMTKCQQYTFVCAPHPVQWAGVAALDVNMQDFMVRYRRKRDLLYQGLRGSFELVQPGGAFYAYPQAPKGTTGSDFVSQAIEKGLLIIPGNVFSRRDTHFRVSYAASDETIQRGIDVLRKLSGK